MMKFNLSFGIGILVGVILLMISRPVSGQENLEDPLRTDTRLAGVFLDPVYKYLVWYDASSEEDVLTIHLGLYAQSLTLQYGREEFYLDSSKNTAGKFSSLSDEEREVLQRLASYLGQKLRRQSQFDASVSNAIGYLALWPAGMPLFVSIDSLTKTVGNVSISMEEIREAQSEALQSQIRSQEIGISDQASAIKSLCRDIGLLRYACYPTSIIPYRERCEYILVGGTSCEGRCGKLCNGQCDQQRYTQECLNHDRCADIYGLTHRYCNFIFPPTVRDCNKAPDCVDLPGVWAQTYTWVGSPPLPATQTFYPDGKFYYSGGVVGGTWSATDTTVKIIFNTGCKPVYMGTLSKNRLTARGTMRCRTSNLSGTWSAAKTDRALVPVNSSPIGNQAVAVDGSVLPNPPD